MDLMEAAVARLFAADPQASLDEVLALLEAHTDAEASGLFVANGGGLELVALRGLDGVGLDRVRALWARDEHRLKDGRPTWEGRQCLWPIESARRQGLIFLEGPEALQVPLVRQAVDELGPLFSTALDIRGLPTSIHAGTLIDRYLEATPTESVHKRQLLALLNRNEWNLSRVARLLGVTRVTIYHRMQRLSIARVKVPKTIR
jgi:hypothetical protein